jgi:F-type H+-transporting ATPase subunit epsilon
MKVSVISPDRTIYEGEADSIVVPAWDGKLGVMPGHAPMLVLLGEGEMRVTSNGTDERFHISGGFLQVVDDIVTVLSERAS